MRIINRRKGDLGPVTVRRNAIRSEAGEIVEPAIHVQVTFRHGENVVTDERKLQAMADSVQVQQWFRLGWLRIEKEKEPTAAAMSLREQLLGQDASKGRAKKKGGRKAKASEPDEGQSAGDEDGDGIPEDGTTTMVL